MKVFRFVAGCIVFVVVNFYVIKLIAFAMTYPADLMLMAGMTILLLLLVADCLVVGTASMSAVRMLDKFMSKGEDR
jgi:hypothetical protein